MSPATIGALRRRSKNKSRPRSRCSPGYRAGSRCWAAVERIFSLVFHLSAAVLVLQAFTRRNNGWLLLAIGWHALVDFGTIMFQSTVKNAVLTEGVDRADRRDQPDHHPAPAPQRAGRRDGGGRPAVEPGPGGRGGGRQQRRAVEPGPGRHAGCGSSPRRTPRPRPPRPVRRAGAAPAHLSDA